jgi:hypothetical protein
VDTSHRPTPRPPAALLAAASGIRVLVVLAPALLATGRPNAPGLSPQPADAPPGLVELAFQAGAATGIDGNVLLAIAKVEIDLGRARQAQPDELVWRQGNSCARPKPDVHLPPPPARRVRAAHAAWSSLLARW